MDEIIGSYKLQSKSFSIFNIYKFVEEKNLIYKSLNILFKSITFSYNCFPKTSKPKTSL